MTNSGNDIPRRVFALSEITESITRMFEKFYDSPYWIKAEISALNLYPVSGHCFPLMVEKSDGKIKAQIKAIIWKEDLFYITQKFEQVTKEIFREGLNIMFLAYVKFSSTYGLTLQIVDIEPLYTLGEMAQDKINTILQLKKEGIFDKNRLLPLPVLLKNIAVISVETSKGYNDLMVTLKNNPQGYKVLTTLFPAILQGNGAIETITSQLEAIKRELHRFDAVAIVRGGGDDVGLSCYDHISMARAIATFPLPVITGIGHSTNETVVEMVACVNKITPTDVAYFIIAGFIEQDHKLNTIEQELKLGISSLLDQEKLRLSDLRNRVSYYPLRVLNSEGVALKNRTRMLLFSMRNYMESQRRKLADKENRMRLLNPENVLKRGYAIVRTSGKIPSDSADIKKGDLMEIETYKLRISATVENVNTKDGNQKENTQL